MAVLLLSESMCGELCSIAIRFGSDCVELAFDFDSFVIVFLRK